MLSNAEIQKKALEEMQVENETDAIYRAKGHIANIARQQDIIKRAKAEIERIKGNLALVTIEDYSKIVA